MMVVLDIFNLDGGADPGVNANPSAKSVTYTLDRQLEPGTRYEARLTLTFKTRMVTIWIALTQMLLIQVVDGNLRPQVALHGNIELSPTSGPIGSSVHVTGTGFDPNSNVIITFGLFKCDKTQLTIMESFLLTLSAYFNDPDHIQLQLVTDLIQIQQHLQ